MKNQKIIFITQTDKRTVYVSLLLIILVSSIIALINFHFSSYDLSYFLLVIFFSLFVVLGFYVLLKFKQIILTTDEIKIVFPLLFHSKNYRIDDIKIIEEKDYSIESWVKYSKMPVHEGKQTTVEFNSNKDVLTFNSLDTREYKEFIKVLKKTHNKKDFNTSDYITYDSSWSIVIWSILIVLVLVASMFTYYIN